MTKKNSVYNHYKDQPGIMFIEKLIFTLRNIKRIKAFRGKTHILTLHQLYTYIFTTGPLKSQYHQY